MRSRLIPSGWAAAFAILLGSPAAWSASHSDAPLIKQDPQANITDVYAFIGTKYDDARIKVLNVVVHVRPFSEPGDGVTYDRFADDARYSIHLTNPSSGETIVRYDFLFSGVDAKTGTYRNLNTILSYGLGTEAGPIQDVGDARQNYTQTYNIVKEVNGRVTVVARDRLTPPPNVGARTTPHYNDTKGRAVSGATTLAALDRYTRQTLYSLATGESSFAGPREDGFFSDIPGIFDLLDPRILGPDLNGQRGNGVDGFKGYNVLAYALQIPVDDLKIIPGFPSVGVYASVSRQQVTLRSDSARPADSGPWIQVNRMGNPLFNEGLVALRDKDNYNRSSPPSDKGSFATYALNPELAFLINFVFGTTLESVYGRRLRENGRADIAGIYIPDVLRVNTSTDPVRLAGQPGFSRLSFLGGDTTAGGVPSGWPNGRRFGDDVVDIALIAVANAPGETPLILLGDNINANDQLYNRVFPYSATPHAGPTNRKDP